VSDKVKIVLEVLNAHGIDPYEDNSDLRKFPEIGRITADETFYTTSLDQVFGGEFADARGEELPFDDARKETFEDPRLAEWFERLRFIVENSAMVRHAVAESDIPHDAPEPYCAWYQPIHFFGHAWGIYIREECILKTALHIARYTDWTAVRRFRVSLRVVGQQLYRSAFYTFFLHEQFHHKVESLGFRLLVACATDRYRPYKHGVYRPTFLTNLCLEESLANAESYLRLAEFRYKQRHLPPVLDAVRLYLRINFASQPPGYREAAHFLTDSTYQTGQQKLQSQVLDGSLKPKTPPAHWVASPDVIRALTNIDRGIYLILSIGSRPLFPGALVNPVTARSAS
jgi:hypothetical protein